MRSLDLVVGIASSAIWVNRLNRNASAHFPATQDESPLESLSCVERPAVTSDTRM